MKKNKPRKTLDELEKAIDKAKKEHARQNDDKQASSHTGDAMRIGVELVAGVAVGVLVGYYLDKWLGTSPVFFIVCFFLGTAGSVINISKFINKK